MAYTEEELKKELETKEYEYGFYTDIESDTFPKGLNEDVVKKLSYTLEIKGHLLADPRISNKTILDNCVLIDVDNPQEHLFKLLKEDKWVK